MEPAFLNSRPPFWARLATLLFPASCVHCGGAVESADLGALCRTCWSGAPFPCAEDGARRGPAWHFDGLSCAGAFDGAFRDAIHAYKFGAKTAFRRPFLGLLSAMGGAAKADFVAWPPTAGESLQERGFDSTAELARSLARRLGVPLYRGLRRARQGQKQAKLGREERWLNARGAFEASGGLEGKSVLLVDDVVTTGATLSECAAALKRAGAVQVRCVALASGELRGN